MTQITIDTITFQTDDFHNFILLQPNGYINVTRMCESVGKNFDQWLEEESSQALLQEIGEEDLIIDNKFEFGGTYAHPKIAIHVALWCSAKYAASVMDAVINFYTKQAMGNLEESINKLAKIQSCNDVLIIIKNNSSDEDYSYSAICTIKRKTSSLIFKNRKKYPSLKVIHLMNSDDADLLWQEYVLNYQDKVTCDEFNFSLHDFYNENDLIHDLDNLSMSY